jgi:hypothetical protein
MRRNVAEDDLERFRLTSHAQQTNAGTRHHQPLEFGMGGQAVDHLIERHCRGRQWFDLRRLMRGRRVQAIRAYMTDAWDHGVQSDQGARGRHLLRG